ncbi:MULTISPECIES: hypothetical protein [unclassified Streptomyces]|uniref:hypothetical protein n=1 Tax=unclassified Streptomyces TaxID=2593676 RepID=UPI002365D62B|nr:MULTISPECIES: hypothetical protein [unclassified Streptomyces]MDF3147083.1 hypothetical protein [Streptomyces sp. T21Q-yed]WDF43528.1 hypothetical protein PBV52_45510 [Streptomyces sp. T12]
MNPDVQREVIPRDDTLRLIDALDVMTAKLLDAAEQWELLDQSGHVPAAPSYAELLQHAADAQDLSRDVLRLAADFARSPHSTNRAGSAVLAHLATAATLSSHAAPHFTETAETALSLSLSRSFGPTDRTYPENRMVIDHATARAYLRRTSESLRDAAKELTAHLDFRRFFPTPSQRQSPAPAPPRPSTRHR